jgi:hypothetical protein
MTIDAMLEIFPSLWYEGVLVFARGGKLLKLMRAKDVIKPTLTWYSPRLLCITLNEWGVKLMEYHLYVKLLKGYQISVKLSKDFPVNNNPYEMIIAPLLNEQLFMLRDSMLFLQEGSIKRESLKQTISVLYRSNEAFDPTYRAWIRASKWMNTAEPQLLQEKKELAKQLRETLKAAVPSIENIYGEDEIRYMIPPLYRSQTKGGVKLPWENERVDQNIYSQGAVDRWVYSTCNICSIGCGCYIAVKDNKIVGIKGNENHSINRGRLDPKGENQWYANNSPDRLLTPLIRNQSGKLVPASWDDAMDLLVEKTRETLKKLGKNT